MITKKLPIDKLVVSDLNTRKDLNAGQEDSDIQKLAEDIAKHGVLMPLIVRPRPDRKFEVISGQRRLLACQIDHTMLQLFVQVLPRSGVRCLPHYYHWPSGISCSSLDRE